jgi:hypothetical protein
MSHSPKVGSGRKRKSIDEKLATGSKNLNVLRLPEVPMFEIPMQEMPKLREYMSREQKFGDPLLSAQIYKEVWEWLVSRGCDRLIAPFLVENYAQNFARWIQAEDLVSSLGLVTKGRGDIAKLSPFITMAHSYHTKMMADWMQIWQTVRENFSGKFEPTPHDDMMERLLSQPS